MRKLVWCPGYFILLLAIEILASANVQAQTDPPKNQSTDSIDSVVYLDQLQTCREGILDERARPADRRRWVEMLFSYNSEHARSMMVELFQMSDRPKVQQTLCDVLRSDVRNHPTRISDDYLEPLIHLLGASQDNLRQAASFTLSDFPGAQVPVRLGQIAADAQESRIKRLAAVDALAPNIHRRDVVRQLIQLLDVDDREIAFRVMGRLEPVTLETFGKNPERWRLWWIEKSQLRDEDWLGQQLIIYRNRWRRLQEELTLHQNQNRQDREAIVVQTQHFQRELYRAYSPEQRSVRLVEWLDYAHPVVQMTALEIIKSRIGDEGKRPDGQVLAALLRLLNHPSTSIRAEVLQIIQTLNDSEVVDAVLARLDQEKDSTIRQALLKAIGKLNSPAAIPALIKEIANEHANLECVTQAAIALGQIAPGDGDVLALHDPVTPLKNRYLSISVEQMELKAALLTAMAGVAHVSFAPEFMDAVESNDPNVLQPAIRGLRAIGDNSKLIRFRALMSHADPLVRLAATGAVGEMGREDADLETILTRLQPAMETNALVRSSAWHSLQSFMSRRSIEERIEASQRLRDQPDLEIRYLLELVDAFSSSQSDSAYLEKVLDRLTLVLTRQKKYAQSIAYLRQLHQMKKGRNNDSDNGSAQDVGLVWLGAVLRSASPGDVAHVIRQLRQSANQPHQRKIMSAIIEFLDSTEMVENAERTRQLLTTLQSISTDGWGVEWSQALDRWSLRSKSQLEKSKPEKKSDQN